MATNPLLKKVLEHGLPILLFVLVSAFYFYPQLQGKVVQQGDIISFRGMSKEVRDYRENTGEETLWTNSMFGGMPAYQISAPQKKNMLQYVEDLFQLFFDRPIGYFICLMVCFYIMMTALGVSSWLSAIGAIAFALGANNLILFEAGHTSKVRAIAFAMPVLTGVVLTYRNQLISGGLLFTLGMGLSLYANHVQMTYYTGIVLAIYVIFKLVEAFREKTLPVFAKASGVLLIGLILAAGSSASKLWTTYSYGKDTMRGKPILEQDAGPAKSSSEVEGLEFGYAMNWSNGVIDLFSAFIPGVAGGGSAEVVSKSAPLYDDANWRNIVTQQLRGKAPLYWGSLPFTSGPIYFGAVICFLFVMGLSLIKGPFKWWIAIAVTLLFLLSLGKNFETFNQLFFDYFPLYNKFRTPNSILSIAAILFPLLGFFGLSKVLQGKVKKAEAMKALQIAGGSLGAIALFFALLGPSFFDFSAAGDARFPQGLNIDPLIETRKSLMRSDALRSLLLIALTGGAIWAYLQEKIKATQLLVAIGLLAVFDAWTVGRRYLDEDNFVSERNYEQNFQPRPADQQILQDKDPNFRVFDLSVDPFNSAFPSYFHKNVGGYHPAKLQRYQDLIDYHISKNNQQVLAMLNTKYVISRDGQVQGFPNPAGNAWFVSSIKTVPSANAEIEALNGFNPTEEAIVHQEYSDYVAGLSPQKNGSISLTDYQPNKLVYSSNTNSEQFAVFSEIWYGPDKGWQAYIDDQPVDHIRVNYVLRGLKVPAGQHTIRFEFEPQAYYAGETISLISSLLILLAVIGWFGPRLYRQLTEESVQTAPAAKTTEKKVKPVKSKRKKKK